jgi:glycerophosphoryl diester phosphodiesterase
VISKDKKVVVSHDTWMSAEITTKPNGEYVTAAEEKIIEHLQMNYEEIKNMMWA